MTREQQRLNEAQERIAHWKRWGPCVSERQWGTVREDYSAGGTAWDDCPHDHARSRAYRWGEDGIAGISANHQRLCFARAFWNGRDPFLTLDEVSLQLSRRLAALFRRDASGRRPAHGDNGRFRSDPHWRDLVLFYEYFNGDTGAGVGASHQTGWTALVAKLLEQCARRERDR